MTLEIYYLISLSVAATLFSILMIFGIITGVMTAIRINRILKKIEKILDYSNQIGFNINHLIQVITEDLIAAEKGLFNGIIKLILLIKDIFFRKEPPVEPEEEIREKT
ncbi:MAG: hypothetical protein ACYDBV_10370 [Nitrospiria bacterium]